MNPAIRLLLAFGVASAFCVNAYASAPLPTPVIDSVTPTVITASLSPQTFTITGHDFISGDWVQATAMLGSGRVDLVRSTIFVSATKMTFTVQCLPTESGVVEVRVTNANDAYSVAPTAMTLQAQLSDLTPIIFDEGNILHTDPRAIRTVVRAQVTPHSNATLIFGGTLLYPYENYLIAGVLTAVDDDGDGVVAFPALGNPTGNIVFVVVDLSGVMHMTQAPLQESLPDSTWIPSQPHAQRSPDGTVSRYDLGFSRDYAAHFLWVRPGVGAWSVYAVDHSAADTDGVPSYDNYAVVRTAAFQPLFAASGPPPQSFAPSDIVAISTPHEWSVERLQSPLTGSSGGQIKLFSDFNPPTEGNDCKVYVRRVNGSEGPVSVSYHTSDNTARSGIDYLATAGTVTFAPGEYVKTISIPTIDDGAYGYGGKSFLLDIVAADGVTAWDTGNDVFIRDAQSAPVISVADVRVNEGDDASRTVQVPVILSGKSLVTTSLFWHTTDDHQNSGPSHALSFAPGETQKFIPITYAGNSVPDPDRTITIHFSSPEHATLGNETATLTILDDDTQALSVDDTTAEEQSETATFLVTMSRAVNVPVTVRYATVDGTATAPLDYAAASGILTFAPRETAKTVTVAIVPDGVVDPDETFTLRLSDATGATISKSSGTATIVEPSRFPQPVVLIDDIAVAEGNVGTTDATFNVRLSFASTLPVVVAWRTENGSARDDSDYAAGIGTITFAPGETVKAVTVKISGDTTPEPNETFGLVIIGASNAIPGSGGTCTIVNDDGQPPPPRHRPSRQ
ncbi:MAG TPA: Calx-beta domain-containing protein [Thermoanaerobaculia bacterium]|nr:Calx-beta domain-containing protein [Thermoanaerobaculia bacterium]